MRMEKEAGLFKLLSDTTRLRLAVLLSIHGEICVCDLAYALNEPDFKISRHLSKMRSDGFVIARRDATWMHYRLNEPRSELEQCLLECLKNCLSTHPTILNDLNRFKRSTCKN